MQTPSFYSLFNCHNQWRPDNILVERSLPPKKREWMSDKGSLTAALQAISDGTFRVNVLAQNIGLPLWHEQTKLQRDLHLAAMIREVELCIHNEAVVYARSIIPLNLASNGRRGLGALGVTPLGHLLFKDGKMRISKRQFLCMSLSSKPIYARRTPYDYLGSQILVSEAFLPAIDKYL